MATSAVISCFGLYGLKTVNSNMVEIADRSVPALLRVSDMRATYLTLIPQLYNRATTTEAERGATLEKALEGGNAELIKLYRLGLSGHGFATQAASRMA